MEVFGGKLISICGEFSMGQNEMSAPGVVIFSLKEKEVFVSLSHYFNAIFVLCSSPTIKILSWVK